MKKEKMPEIKKKKIIAAVTIGAVALVAISLTALNSSLDEAAPNENLVDLNEEPGYFDEASNPDLFDVADGSSFRSDQTWDGYDNGQMSNNGGMDAVGGGAIDRGTTDDDLDAENDEPLTTGDIAGEGTSDSDIAAGIEDNEPETTETADGAADAEGTGIEAEQAANTEGIGTEAEQAAVSANTGNVQAETGEGVGEADDASADNSGNDGSADAAQTSVTDDDGETEANSEAVDGEVKTDADASDKTAEEMADASSEKEVADSEDSGHDAAAEVSAEALAALSFGAESRLMWPVQGNIVLGYSADHGIYHPTMEQFRVNPAVLIGCGEGQEVLAAAKGIVTAIEESSQTGMTITTAIGNGYEIAYGQLSENELKVGDTVEEGAVLGTTAKATRFYTLEGDNLYFKVTKDGEPVNPLTLLKELEEEEG